MGQYIHVGICFRIQVNERELEQAQMTTEAVEAWMAKSRLEPSMYERSSAEEMATWTLKSELAGQARSQLVLVGELEGLVDVESGTLTLRDASGALPGGLVSNVKLQIQAVSSNTQSVKPIFSFDVNIKNKSTSLFNSFILRFDNVTGSAVLTTASTGFEATASAYPSPYDVVTPSAFGSMQYAASLAANTTSSAIPVAFNSPGNFGFKLAVWADITPLCIPSPEICDNLDNDCNGTADDGNPGGGVSCSVPGQSGVCAAGTTVCSSGSLSCPQTVFPTTEINNGLDDDCDGATDEVPPSITSASFASFSEGAASSFFVVATGSPSPTFSYTGSLPGGVTLTGAGLLSGTPDAGTAGS